MGGALSGGGGVCGVVLWSRVVEHPREEVEGEEEGEEEGYTFSLSRASLTGLLDRITGAEGASAGGGGVSAMRLGTLVDD